MIPTEVHNAITKRAARKCECTNPKCGHEVGKCVGKIDGNAGVSIPENTPEVDMERLGELCCDTCFQASGSYVRQQAYLRGRFASSGTSDGGKKSGLLID